MAQLCHLETGIDATARCLSHLSITLNCKHYAVLSACNYHTKYNAHFCNQNNDFRLGGAHYT